jgi:hypothetical protein
VNEQPAPAAPAGWHWFHYPVGIFLVAYGAAGLPLLAIGWSDRRDEVATYMAETVGLGIATPMLVAAKVVEVLLTLLALAGLLRRRDVWYLPAILGWVSGFAAFCVLDVWSGRYGGLAEHAVYLLGFLLLLAASFAFGVKARLTAGHTAASHPDDHTDDHTDAGHTDGRSAPRPRLTRTQEMALAALNRWQRTPLKPR